MTQNYVWTIFFKAFCMTTKPLNIAAKIIFMSRQYNLNTRNLKIIPYNQEKMQIKHDALFLHISIYQLIRLCLTFCSLWRCKKQTADRNTPVIGKSPGSDTIKPLVARERVVKREMSHLMTKPTKWHVRPAKTQIRLGGGQKARLIWVFAGRIVILLASSWGTANVDTQTDGQHSDQLSLLLQRGYQC